MKVVLVEPEIPFNTGSIGRTCVALDLELILIGRLGFSLDSASVARSGTRYWKFVEISLYDCWDSFLLERSPLDEQLYFFEEDGSHSFYTPTYHPQVCLDEADRSTVWPMFITAQVMLAITRVVEILFTSA